MRRESKKGALSESVWVNSANWPKMQDALQMNGLGKFDRKTRQQTCLSARPATLCRSRYSRSSTAMELLQCGVDRSVIALWLGHERMDTTQIYLPASLELKEKALVKTQPFYGRPRRYRPPEQLMAFLQSL